MKHEEFGDTNDYLRAFEQIVKEGIHSKHLELLNAHFNAPKHTATWEQLSKAVDYKNGKAVNSQYGTFAGRVAKKLGLTEKPNGFWIYVIAGWAGKRDPLTDHTAFVLRRPVISALIKLELLHGNGNSSWPGEYSEKIKFYDGAPKRVYVNAYERNPLARRQCLAFHGVNCKVCNFSFGEAYGSKTDGFIHVHHINPLAEICIEREVDPEKDLIPVCPNCHAVIHFGGGCRTIEEVKRMLRR